MEKVKCNYAHMCKNIVCAHKEYHYRIDNTEYGCNCSDCFYVIFKVKCITLREIRKQKLDKLQLI